MNFQALSLRIKWSSVRLQVWIKIQGVGNNRVGRKVCSSRRVGKRRNNGLEEDKGANCCVLDGEEDLERPKPTPGEGVYKLHLKANV